MGKIIHFNTTKMRKDRAQVALTMLGMEIRNAGARQRSRLKNKHVLSLSTEGTLYQIRSNFKELRKWWNKLERLEKREMEMREKREVSVTGQNIKLVGTYGRN